MTDAMKTDCWIEAVGTCVAVSPYANPIGDIGFVHPFYVNDGNRPLAPVLRQRGCSLMNDVY
jgi:hypothetical protein